MDKKRKFISKISIISLILLLIQIIYILLWVTNLGQVWPFTKLMNDMPGFPFSLPGLILAIVSRQKINDKASLILIILNALTFATYIAVFIFILVAIIKVAAAMGI